MSYLGPRCLRGNQGKRRIDKSNGASEHLLESVGFCFIWVYRVSVLRKSVIAGGRGRLWGEGYVEDRKGMLFGSFHTGSSASAYFMEARRFWFLEPHPWTWEHGLFGAQMVQAVQHGFPNIPGGHGSAWVIDGLATCMVLVFLCAWLGRRRFPSPIQKERA